jgi:hypothetical protein
LVGLRHGKGRFVFDHAFGVAWREIQIRDDGVVFVFGIEFAFEMAFDGWTGRLLDYKFGQAGVGWDGQEKQGNGA